MISNKFELRSNEVQEVFQKSPHLLIMWGNTFIGIILIAGFYLLDNITIPQKITIPFQLIQTKKPYNSEEVFALQIDTEYTSHIYQHQPININFEKYPSNIYGTIQTEIDTIISFQNKKIIFFKLQNEQSKNNLSFRVTLKPFLLGNLVTQIDKKNFLSTIKNSLFSKIKTKDKR